MLRAQRGPTVIIGVVEKPNWARGIGLAATAAALLSLLGPAASGRAATGVSIRSLDGSGNNLRHPGWGKAQTRYLRVAPPRYADGVRRIAAGPPPRYVSNRIFNDGGQNLFSENDASQWGWAWGQFIDHDIGRRAETGGESAPIGFSATDPLEAFSNDLGSIGFNRTPAAPGSGTTHSSPRQQVNTLSSYIDSSNVYGVGASRLDWLRAGRLDADPSDNSARLLLPGGYLPTASARANAGSTPPMQHVGALAGHPADAFIAGDGRANENVALAAIQTLFAREHNRILSLLPSRLPSELRFQIARRVLNAEEQYVTYEQFLPALGVKLPPYRGYAPGLDAGIENEFATVGFRAHSMVHGDFNIRVAPGTYSASELDAFRAAGVTIGFAEGKVIVQIPLAVSFGNPGLLRQAGLGLMLKALGEERQYRNDEQIDDSLRSVLFQVPKPGVPDPTVCGPDISPDCFSAVQDLGAIDIQRGRDHGIPHYNALRRAYGLAPRRSFAALTGEAVESIPADPLIDQSDPIDDPNILDFVELRDRFGTVVPPQPGARGLGDEANDTGLTAEGGLRAHRAPRRIYGDAL